MSGLAPDGTAEPASRDQLLRREQGDFPCSADHEQDWQPFTLRPIELDYRGIIIWTRAMIQHHAFAYLVVD